MRKRLLALALCVAHLATHAAAKARSKSFVTVASFYSRKFTGRKTATGSRYDPGLLTAAHRTLPLGSWIRVWRGRRSTCVQVNDRGPWTGTRGLDLSEAAARRLGMIGLGIARVTVDPEPKDCPEEN